MEKNKLPKISELTLDVEKSYKGDQLNQFLNHPPKKEWIREHPYIKGHLYIPIGVIEMLLKMIFKQHRIEITGQGTSFNGVWVTVRVHFVNPVTDEWDFHDGIGAIQLQTKKGSTPADLANINNGALSMAYPHAKTLAIKDATDHFGKLFGADLNRKDTLSFMPDEKLKSKEEERIDRMIDNATSRDDLQRILDSSTIPDKYVGKFKERMEQLK